MAIVVVGRLLLALALSESFVQLAPLSVVTRLFGYLDTAILLPILRRRRGQRVSGLRLPGIALIPVVAPLLSLGLLASAGASNQLAAALPWPSAR